MTTYRTGDLLLWRGLVVRFQAADPLESHISIVRAVRAGIVPLSTGRPHPIRAGQLVVVDKIGELSRRPDLDAATAKQREVEDASHIAVSEPDDDPDGPSFSETGGVWSL